jgi:hypothetical protein
MMRGGGGGGGLTRHYVIEPLKNLTLFTGAVYLIGGTSAAVAFVWFVLHVGGLSVGYVVTGFPVGVDSFHQGSGQMTKYMAAIRCRARRRTPLVAGPSSRNLAVEKHSPR